MPKAASTGFDLPIFFLRFLPGVMMLAYHGWGKLSGAYAHLVQGQPWGLIDFVAKLGFPLPVVFAVCAALAESVAALLLALGLWTRLNAAVLAFNMGVAVYYHVRTDMKIEMAALYLLYAVVFLLLPAGRFSLDQRFGRRK